MEATDKEKVVPFGKELRNFEKVRQWKAEITLPMETILIEENEDNCVRKKTSVQCKKSVLVVF